MYNNYFKGFLAIEGQDLIKNRGLDPEIAQNMGVYSIEDEIFFRYLFNGNCLRTKIVAKDGSFKFTPIFSGMEQCPHPFWNQQVFEDQSYVIITENEFDAIAIAQIGKANVISFHSGLNNCTTTVLENYLYLLDFKEIFISLSNGEKGEASALKLKKVLPTDRVRIIYIPAENPNAWLVQSKPTAKDLETLMQKSRLISYPEIVNLRDVDDGYKKARELGLSSGFVEIDGLLGGIRLGELTVVSADTGCGKTTFSIQLLCNIITKNNQAAWINSWEMDYETVIRKIVGNILKINLKTRAMSEQECDRFEEWIKKNNVFINPMDAKATVDTLSKHVEFAYRVNGVKYFLFDHLDYISTNDLKQDNHERVLEVMQALHLLAKKFKIHIFLIVHPTQAVPADGEIQMNMLKGGASIKQYASNVIFLKKAARTDPNDSRVFVSIKKNREFGIEGKCELRYEKRFDGYVSGKEYNSNTATQIQSATECLLN